MIKHAIIYDDNKSILVVIMPVYVIGAAIFLAMRLWWRSTKASREPRRAKSTRDMMMELHMTEFVFLCRMIFFGLQNI